MLPTIDLDEPECDDDIDNSSCMSGVSLVGETSISEATGKTSNMSSIASEASISEVILGNSVVIRPRIRATRRISGRKSLGNRSKSERRKRKRRKKRMKPKGRNGKRKRKPSILTGQNGRPIW
jgi:hypothetical protein